MAEPAADAAYVLLGDVIESRDIDDRAAFGETLTAALDAVNERYGEHLRADLRTMKGIDEVGGVLEDASVVYDVLKTLSDALHPHQLRVAVCHGRIDVNPDASEVAAMDGPAFHDATEALEGLESNGLLFAFEADNPTVDDLLSSTVNLVLTLREDWTETEFRVVRARERHDSQQAVAAELDRSQQAVSAALGRAHWQRIRTAETTLDRIFKSYIPTINSR